MFDELVDLPVLAHPVFPLARYLGRPERLFPEHERVPPDGVVPPGWRQFVVHADAKGVERVNRVAYEICVLQSPRDRLRCKEIWVEGADRVAQPRGGPSGRLRHDAA